MPEHSTQAMARFLDLLEVRLEDTRVEGARARQGFFAELAPRLETARALEQDLDRHLARRFNVLDYLRSDELGLSRIIADLLDPQATHGQGWLFLQVLLEWLHAEEETRLLPQGWHLAESRATAAVEVERVITDLRRIDVSVEIRTGAGTYCIALENKPYAEDQRRQVADYLDFLSKRYDDRFLLIYLSPTGQAPSEESVSRNELEERWSGRFAIMSYLGSAGDWEDGFVRIPKSFAAWLAECRRRCEVDRLRWFLRDAEVFCERRFGGQTMVGDAERKAVLEFVLSDPAKLKTALAVYECWPAARDDVCARFLKCLCTRVRKDERLRELGPGVTVDCRYEGERRMWNRLWLHRDRWQQRPNSRKSNNPDSAHRYAVRLESYGPGPTGWYIGVLTPTKGSDLSEENRNARIEHFSGLTTKFHRGQSGAESWWTWWENLDEQTIYWNLLVPQLAKECQEEDGPITQGIANRFVEIALEATPLIDAIEDRSYEMSEV